MKLLELDISKFGVSRVLRKEGAESRDSLSAVEGSLVERAERLAKMAVRTCV